MTPLNFRLDDDVDDDLYQNGSVIWAKVAERPWWPCVVFKSWEEMRKWGIPICQSRVVPRDGPLAPHEALGIMLEDYSCEVLDKRQFAGQDWDYISAEAVLCEQRADPNTRKRLKRAIADARLLIALARGSHQSSSSSFLAEQSSYEPLFGDSMLLSESWLDEASALASVSSMAAHKITPRSCSAESQRYLTGSSFGHEDSAVVVSERGDSSDDISDAQVVVASGNNAKTGVNDVTGPRFDDLCEIHFLQACGPPLVSLSPSPSHSPRMDLKRCQPCDDWGDHDVVHPACVRDICDDKASPTFKRVRSNSLAGDLDTCFDFDSVRQCMSAQSVRQLPRASKSGQPA